MWIGQFDIPQIPLGLLLLQILLLFLIPPLLLPLQLLLQHVLQSFMSPCRLRALLVRKLISFLTKSITTPMRHYFILQLPQVPNSLLLLLCLEEPSCWGRPHRNKKQILLKLKHVGTFWMRRLKQNLKTSSQEQTSELTLGQNSSSGWGFWFSCINWHTAYMRWSLICCCRINTCT